MNAKIRKTEINLSTVGTGVLVFGLWTLIKLALTVLVEGNKGAEGIYNPIVWCIVGLYFLISCYIGFSARAESKGKRKSICYLIFAGLHLTVQLAFIAVELYILFTGTESVATMIIAIIIDATALVFVAELMYYSVALRRFRKTTREKGETA